VSNSPNRPSRGVASGPPHIVEKDLSYAIVGSFFSVYNELGYGFTEPVYRNALQVSLQEKGLHVEREVPVAVVFHGVTVGQYRMDLLVARQIIIEVKATERVAEHSKRQLHNYLCAANLELGLLLHFGPKAECHRVLRHGKPNQPRIDSANSDELL
jgi:GxxExxY protein